MLAGKNTGKFVRTRPSEIIESAVFMFALTGLRRLRSSGETFTLTTSTLRSMNSSTTFSTSKVVLSSMTIRR